MCVKGNNNARKVGEVGMIQIDMPMPTNCLDCPACNEYLMCAIPINGRQWRENDVREFGQGRPEWCPMKEQEAVKPKYKERMGGFFVCPTCGTALNNILNVKACGKCGQAVKWNDGG